jgi:predicted Fe-Mo cluster-binding NifX family protein
MRIAVASDDNENICGHVGKCKGFVVLNVENGKILTKEVRKNSFTNHFNRSHNSEHQNDSHQRGHGLKDGHKRLAQGLKDCDYLISHGMGRRLIEDIESQGIKTIVTTEQNVESAAISLELGNLQKSDHLICG